MQYHWDRPVAYLSPAVQVWQEVNGFYRHNLAASSTAAAVAMARLESIGPYYGFISIPVGRR